MCEWVPGFKEQGSVLHKKCFQKCIKGWTKVCEEKELMMLITVTKTIAKEFATHKSHRLHASEGFPLL